MNIFTAGQVARMRAVLEPGGFRDTVAYTNYTGELGLRVTYFLRYRSWNQ